MMWGYGWGSPVMLWMGLGGILWLVALGLLVWALVRWLGGRAPTSNLPPKGPSAMEILQQRYARGEIDATTYEQMRERLQPSQEQLRGRLGNGHLRASRRSISRLMAT